MDSIVKFRAVRYTSQRVIQNLAPRRMRRIRIMMVWLLISAALFVFMSVRSSGFHWASGATSHSSYGWPTAWLDQDKYQTFVQKADGSLTRDEYWVKWHLSSWPGLVCSIAIALAVSGVATCAACGLKRYRKVPTNASSLSRRDRESSG